MKKTLAAALAFAALGSLPAQAQAQDGAEIQEVRQEPREFVGARVARSLGDGERRDFREHRREFHGDRRDLRDARRHFRRHDRSRYVYVQPRSYYHTQPSFGFSFGYRQPYYRYNRPYYGYSQPHYGYGRPHYGYDSYGYDGYGYDGYGYDGYGYDRGYYPPRRWSRGQYLPPEYRRVIVYDYNRYGYGPPPHGYQYYRASTGEIILAAIATGLILSVFAGAF